MVCLGVKVSNIHHIPVINLLFQSVESQRKIVDLLRISTQSFQVLKHPRQMCYNHNNTYNIMAGVVDPPPASREIRESPAGAAERPKVELA